MPIEFRCTQCNRLLRTQDETAGKQAKCPECGTILTIPAAGAPAEPTPPTPAAPEPSPAGAASPGAGAESPFGPSGPPPSGAASPFAPGAAPGAENPYASPTDYTAGAPAAYAPAAGRVVPTQIEMGDVFNRTWEIFKEQWGMCLALVFVAWLINFGVGFVAGFIPFVGGIASMLFSVWIYIGVALGLLKIARGQQAEVGDIFTGGPYFVPVFFGSFLYAFMVLGVFGVCFGPALAVVLLAMQGVDPPVIIFAVVALVLVCLVPTTVVSLMFSQFYYLIIDQNLGIMESLSLSKQVMAGNKLTVFLLNFLVGICGMLLAVVTCLVGLFAVVPFVALLKVIIYLAVTGQPTAQAIRGGPTMV